jgi:hypothetical protein
MTNNKQQSRTFELKVTVKASTMEAISELLEMQQNILSGEMQREIKKDGFDKVIATFEEVSNENQG